MIPLGRVPGYLDRSVARYHCGCQFERFLRMKKLSPAALLALAICIVLTGCDPVRTTRQGVTLRLVNSDTKAPIANARVRLKDDFDRQDHTYPNTASQEEWEVHARRNWEQAPWFVGTTDANGTTTVNIEYTALDRTRGDVAPANSRDWVTGKPFLVEISVDERPTRVLSVELKSGNVVADSDIVLRVDAVESPVYIPTQ